jgi:cysteinyl-tRNA synthetase
MREADRIFDVLDETPARNGDDAEIDALVAERDAARAARDFARADALRDALAARGIELLDGTDATRWRRR